MRTKISRLVAAPEELVRVTLVPKSALFDVKATENPLGAVTVTLAERFVPWAKNERASEATLMVELKAGRLFVLTVISGGGLVTTPLSETLLVAPAPESARLPARLLVAGALVEMRTSTTPPLGGKSKLLDAFTNEFVEIS